MLQGKGECATLRDMTTLSKNGKLIGRPPGKMTREEQKRRHPNDPGTKAKAIGDLVRYAENPDKPMVPPHLAKRLAETRNMAMPPSKLFEDNGHTLNAIQYLAARAEYTKPAKTPEDVFATLEEFFTFCGTNLVAPTLGAWAVWNGVSLVRICQIEKEPDRARAQAFTTAKECIRQFMEQRAWNNALNPLIFFNAQKSMFGIVEISQTNITIEDNTVDMTDEEYEERIVLLQGEDGVYREG